MLKILAALVVLMSTVGSLRAQTYASDMLVYTNKGTYVADFYAQWLTRSGTTCRVKYPPNSTGRGHTVSFDLTDTTRWDWGAGVRGTPEKCRLEVGDEVWGFVSIVSGDKESCRLSAKIRFHPDGETVRYRRGRGYGVTSG